MSEITVRTARSADALAVGGLVKELGYEIGEIDIPARMDHLRNSGRVAIFVAEQDGEVIGLATAHILSVLNRVRDVVWLTAIVVAEAHRGRSVGRRLVRAVEEFAERCDCERFSVTTYTDFSGAQAFYRSCGLVQTGLRFGKNLRRPTERR